MLYLDYPTCNDCGHAMYALTGTENGEFYKDLKPKDICCYQASELDGGDMFCCRCCDDCVEGVCYVCGNHTKDEECSCESSQKRERDSDSDEEEDIKTKKEKIDDDNETKDEIKENN